MTLSERALEKNNIELIGADEIFSQVPRWNRYLLLKYYQDRQIPILYIFLMV